MRPKHTQVSRRARGWSAVGVVAAITAVGIFTGLLAPGGGQARSQAAPANTGPPTISGAAVKGNTLSATSGSWSGTAPITFAYSWRRCDSNGADCAAIGGATAATYTIGDSDVDRRLRVEVTATNGDGTAAALSAPSDVVTAGAAPANTVEPTISGGIVEGQTLSATSGSWAGTSPITYGYQWVRCGTDGGNATGSNCLFISGATKSTYVVDDDDVTRRLRVRVTATNSIGATTVASDATATVVAKTASGPPVNTAEPKISGTAKQGQTLTTTAGSWTGAAPITVSYQWVRCGANGGNADGSDCAPIAGATKNTFTLASGDVGKRIRARVNAKNGSGSKTVASNATVTVTNADPSGTITLPNGEKSVPVATVPATTRLVVDQVRFAPNPVRSRRQTITVRIKVEDTRGFVVRDAFVFIRSTPKVTSGGDRAKTGTDGWLTYTLVPERDFPVKSGYNVQFFVKAYRAGDPILGGVAGTRLVQVATAP
jgi:hypothetical protein